MAKKNLSTAEVIGEREAARLAKHYSELDASRLELGRKIGLITKEQDAMKAKLRLYALANGTKSNKKETVAELAKFVISVALVKSCRFISWKGQCAERLGEAVVTDIEADPPEREVTTIDRKAA